MTIDLAKLIPAPWAECSCHECCGSDYVNDEFIALARNAFDGDPAALAWWEANRRRRDEVKP